MPRPKNPSKKFKLDPTGSLQWERKYEEAALPLIDNFEKRVIEDFTQAWETGKIRKLETGKLDPSTFYPHIDELAEQEIVEPVGESIEKVIPKAYQQGNVFASIQLGAPLEERQQAWRKIGTLIEESKTEFKGYSSDTSREIKRIISDGILNEKTQGQIIKDIRDQFHVSKDEAGKFIYNAERIIRTETMKSVNTGVLDRYKQGGIEYVKWLAVGDDRCCSNCQDLDGKIFPIDEVPPCPKHPGCRCTWTPVVRPPGEKGKEPEEGKPMTGEEVRERTLAIAQKHEKERTALEQRLAKAKDEMQILSDKHSKYVQNFFDAKRTGDSAQMAYWEKEVAAISTECDRSIQSTHGLQQQINVIKETQNKAIHDLLYLRDKSIVKYQVYKTAAVYQKNKKALDEGFDFFGRVVKDDEIWKTSVKVNTCKSYRAYEKGGEIWISTHSDSKTVAHELGHVMEERSKAVVAAEHEFYVTRTKTEPLITMNKATGASGYRTTEKTKKDEFPDAYCGKDYGGRNYELLSMGSGWLKSDPGWFAKTDPDYFAWTVNTLRGIL